ncbi:MAG: Gfo/Idh/MocA family oxidoreductase [Eubacterium sp.]|nr:Gfo/Idh/MocA family oxidoreductase [Eubacterium sp.]
MKLGIIGTGKIIVDALYAMEPIDEIICNAIWARPHSRKRGEELAAQYSIPEVYTDYDELLSGADIDTVYIGLINSVHYSYAKKALEYNKNVILEKPFTGTYEEAKELFDLARERNLFVFEAITVLHNDVIEKMRENLPRLGKIRMMLANFSQYSSRYDRYLAGEVDHSFDPEYLGGALRDINVYNLHYAAELFGVPEKTQYYPNTGFNGVDISGTMVLEYEGFTAVCTGAKDSDSPCFVQIQGEKGYMRIDGKPNVAPNLTIVISGEGEPVKDAAGAMVRHSVQEEFTAGKVHHRMTREFMDFAQIIDQKDAAQADRYASETLGVMKILSES